MLTSRPEICVGDTSRYDRLREDNDNEVEWGRSCIGPQSRDKSEPWKENATNGGAVS